MRTVLTRISSFLNVIGALWILLLSVLICVDVAMRLTINKPLMGVYEIVSISISAIIFIQLSHSIATKRVVRAELLHKLFQSRAPVVARLIDIASTLLAAGLMIVIAVGVGRSAYTDFLRGAYFGTQGVFIVATWPFKATISVGAFLSALQFIALGFPSTTRATKETP